MSSSCCKIEFDFTPLQLHTCLNITAWLAFQNSIALFSIVTPGKLCLVISGQLYFVTSGQLYIITSGQLYIVTYGQLYIVTSGQLPIVTFGQRHFVISL